MLIGKALVEIPPKFAGRPPVNPNAQAELERDSAKWHCKGAQGVAEDMRYYGQWMRDEAERRIGHLYPKAELPDGSKATVIAWLWARTVRSPDPAAKGAMVPLASTFMLCTKVGRKAWAEPLLDQLAPDGWRFEVNEGGLSKEGEALARAGTKSGRGADFHCILTGSGITGAYIKEQGKAGLLGARLMAIVYARPRGRGFLSPTDEHEAAAHMEVGTVIDLPTSRHPQYMGCVPYGLDSFQKLFTPRQVSVLDCLSKMNVEVFDKVISDSMAANVTHNEDYAKAVCTYLSFVVDRMADYGSSLSTWLTDDNAIRGTFGRQAIPMTWDYCEANFLGDSSAAVETALSAVSNVVSHQMSQGIGRIDQLDAAENGYEVGSCVINTDPPYYDNIPYSDLSDFFYCWMKKQIGDHYPEHFRTITTPKSKELVADVKRHGGRAEAEKFFMDGMSAAVRAMWKASVDDAPIVIYYAFKQSEAAEGGTTSAGWASFLQGVVDAGLAVDATWPLRTESAARMRGNNSNALASSVVLVCRKRSDDAPIINRTDFVRLLRRELPDAIDDIRKAGVGPVDMQQSVIGPGMGVFSRHAKILMDDDSALPVKMALAEINRIWGEIENEGDASLDAETQVALAWFASYGFDAKSSGELITLANAKNIPTSQLFKSDVFDDLSGKAGLKPRERLSPDWTPAGDASLTIWECVQHAARVLGAEDGGDAAAARMIAQMGPKAADARALAYRLFQIATDKGWAAEALVYNELAAEWPRLEALAEGLGSANPEEKGKLQYDLL